MESEIVLSWPLWAAAAAVMLAAGLTQGGLGFGFPSVSTPAPVLLLVIAIVLVAQAAGDFVR